MSIKQFDRALARKVGERGLELLKALEKEFGVSVARGSGRFDDNTFSIKFEISVVGGDGVPMTREMENLKERCGRHGIQFEAFNQPFKQGRSEYKVIGYRYRARKNPFICERVKDGKQFVFPAETIEHYYRNGAAENSRHLREFLEAENRTAKLFGRSTLNIDELKQADANELYQRLDCNMSPENLTCDGELPQSEVARRARMYRGAAADLDKLGFRRPDNLYSI